MLFAVAGSFALIVVGRVLQGLASGAALGTLSAAMVESDAERGTAASAASPGAGSGSGALLSGLVVQFLPDPRQTIYLILAAILAIQALFVLRVIPCGQRRPLSWKAVSPRVAVPADAKTTFMSTAPVVFAVWGLSGFYAALSPALYRALSRSDSVWQSTLPLFALLAAATATTIVLRRLNGRVQTITSRQTALWGEGTTAVASDSTHFSAFDQNIFTEWHSRYRRAKRGVLIYWTVDVAGSMAVHSQLISCSASEVHAMVEGAMRHGTDMEIEQNFVDSHGVASSGSASPGCWTST